MAAFIVGKSLKDRRQTKAVAELFDLADKNGNGKISVAEYVRIFRYVLNGNGQGVLFEKFKQIVMYILK